MRVTCENCGFGLETDHEGDWDHTCPDGRHGRVVHDGHVDNAFTTGTVQALTVALTDLNGNTIKVADALNDLNTALLGSKPGTWRTWGQWR